MPHSNVYVRARTLRIATRVYVVTEHVDLYGHTHTHTHTLQLRTATRSVSAAVQINVFDYDVYARGYAATRVYVVPRAYRVRSVNAT